MISTLPIVLPTPAWLPTLPVGAMVCVFGGFVRDTLCGRPVRDVDFLIAGATPNELDAHPLLEPRPHPGVLRYGIPTEPDHELMVAPDNGQGACSSMRDSLLSRDLTAHTVGVDVCTGEVLDPTGQGVSDLHGRILRMTHAGVFEEDPNRILRLARLSVALEPFGYRIDPVTEETVRACNPDWARSGLERLSRQWGLIDHDPLAHAMVARLERWGHLEGLDAWRRHAPATGRRLPTP